MRNKKSSDSIKIDYQSKKRYSFYANLYTPSIAIDLYVIFFWKITIPSYLVLCSSFKTQLLNQEAQFSNKLCFLLYYKNPILKLKIINKFIYVITSPSSRNMM